MFKLLQGLLTRGSRATRPRAAPAEPLPAFCARLYAQNGFVRFWREYETKINASEAPEDLSSSGCSARGGKLHQPE
jgi:hypothetical protein